MKPLLRLLALVIIAATARGQVSQHGLTAVPGAPTRSVNAGTTDPATCTATVPPELFLNTTPTPNVLKYCSATNTWTPFGVLSVSQGATNCLTASPTSGAVVVDINTACIPTLGSNDWTGGQTQESYQTWKALAAASTPAGGYGVPYINSADKWVHLTNDAGTDSLVGPLPCSTAGQYFLSPFNATPSTDLGAFTVTANRVYLFALNPLCNYTIRKLAVYQNGIAASKGIAMALLDSTGAILQQNTQVGAFSANTAIQFPITAQALTPGKLYYLAISTEDAAGSIYRTTISAGTEALYNINSQVLVAKCTNAASGTGGSFVINTCGALVANAGDVGVPDIVALP